MIAKAKRQTVFIAILLAFSSSAFSQSIIELNGCWENSSRKITFDAEKKTVNVQLKTYYGLFLDKEYDLAELNAMEVFTDANRPLLLEGNLYFDYCRACDFDGNLFLPCCNVNAILLYPKKVSENVYAFYFADSEKNSAIKIRFWKFEIEPGEEDKFDISENVEFSFGEESKSCPKFIKIGKQLYTCVRGRGKKIRNTETVEFKKLHPDFQFCVQDGSEILLLEKPYLKTCDARQGN